MRRRLFVVLTAGFTLLFLLGGFLFTNTVYAKNTSVHVHVKGDTELVDTLSIIFKGEPYELTTKNGKLYTIRKTELKADIVKQDVSAIVVKMTDSTEVTYSPAIDYAGVEGKGTINYWIEVSVKEEPPVEDSDPPAEEDPVEENDPPTEEEEPVEENDPPAEEKDPVEENEPPADEEPAEESDSDVDEDVSDNPTTVTGGELPDTSSPWYNTLLVSGIIAACAGVSYLALRKIMK